MAAGDFWVKTTAPQSISEYNGTNWTSYGDLTSGQSIDVLADGVTYKRFSNAAQQALLAGGDLNNANLLFNPSFEQGQAFWESPQGTVVNNPANAYTGSQYLEITAPAGVQINSYQQDDSGNKRPIPVTPGDTIQLSGAMMRVSGDAKVRILIHFVGTTSYTEISSTSATWDYQTITEVAPAGATLMFVFCDILESGTVTTVARYDNLRLSISQVGVITSDNAHKVAISMLPNWNLDIQDSQKLPAGLQPVEGINSRAQLDWSDDTRTAMRIHRLGGQVAYGFPAIAIDDQQQYRVTIRHKYGAATTTSGLYLRVNETASALGAGLTHVAYDATFPNAQARDSYVDVNPTDNFPGTAYQVDTYTYTPTPGTKYASFGMYNYSPSSAIYDYDVDYVQMVPIPKTADQIPESSARKWAAETGATKNTFTYSATAPTSPTNGDVWVDTSGQAYVIKSRISGAWQDSGNLITNTNQITADGANLGGTANWSTVANDNGALPADFSTRNKIFRQTTAPTAGMAAGDFWVDTGSLGGIAEYNGSNWITYADTTAGQPLSSLTGVGALAPLNDITLSYVTDAGTMAKVNNNALVYVSTTAPTNPAINPLWVDTSGTPYHLKHWNGSTWTDTATLNTGALANVNAADWTTQVTGTGKPSNNATAGATWGSDIANQPTMIADSMNGGNTTVLNLSGGNFSTAVNTGPETLDSGWVTISPGTGTNQWSALSSLPAGTNWIEISIYYSVLVEPYSSSNPGFYTTDVYITNADAGSSASYSTANEVCALSRTINVSPSRPAIMLTVTRIPINSSKQFQIRSIEQGQRLLDGMGAAGINLTLRAHGV